MLDAPRCFDRQCKHLEGVKELDEELGELSQVFVCPAFPEGIPDEITFGRDKHLTVHPDQVGTTVYEGPDDAE